QLVPDRRGNTVDERLPHLRVLMKRLDELLLHLLAPAGRMLGPLRGNLLA
ncbi:MAG: hypothetical protein JO227_08860, partial [Acetobacteraceae bacterium]|nr:hypothetical protein [Acetobacteraceae bacterium]